MNKILLLLLLGNLQTTSYRSVSSQTDDSPFFTSIGERVGTHVIAVSEDLLCSRAKIRLKNGEFVLCDRGLICPDKKKLHYRDWVYIDGLGFKQVLDVMNPRHRNRIDVWVSTKEEERSFDKKFGGKKLKIWLVKDINNE